MRELQSADAPKGGSVAYRCPKRSDSRRGASGRCDDAASAVVGVDSVVSAGVRGVCGEQHCEDRVLWLACELECEDVWVDCGI